MLMARLRGPLANIQVSIDVFLLLSWARLDFGVVVCRLSKDGRSRTWTGHEKEKSNGSVE